jgi:rod shape-determining protein MreD
MKAVLYILATVAAFTLQTTLFHIFGPVGVWPDFALILAVYGGLRWGENGGTWFGAGIGLLQDLLSFNALGLFTFSKGMTGFLVGFLQRRFLNDLAVTYFFLVAGATLFDTLAYATLTSLVLGHDLWADTIALLGPQALLNAGFAFAFMWVIEQIRPLLDKVNSPDKYRYDDVLH